MPSLSLQISSTHNTLHAQYLNYILHKMFITVALSCWSFQIANVNGNALQELKKLKINNTN